jgi:hypothetical protein
LEELEEEVLVIEEAEEKEGDVTINKHSISYYLSVKKKKGKTNRFYLDDESYYYSK